MSRFSCKIKSYKPNECFWNIQKLLFDEVDIKPESRDLLT